MTIRTTRRLAFALVGGLSLALPVQAQQSPPPAPTRDPTSPPAAAPRNTAPGTAGSTTGNAVRSGDPSSGAGPRAGANSFTEGQARSRMESAGYTNVTGLNLDSNGVWRGQAMRNGRQVQVTLDYQGNVNAQ